MRDDGGLGFVLFHCWMGEGGEADRMMYFVLADRFDGIVSRIDSRESEALRSWILVCSMVTRFSYLVYYLLNLGVRYPCLSSVRAGGFFLS